MWSHKRVWKNILLFCSSNVHLCHRISYLCEHARWDNHLVPQPLRRSLTRGDRVFRRQKINLWASTHNRSSPKPLPAVTYMLTVVRHVQHRFLHVCYNVLRALAIFMHTTLNSTPSSSSEDPSLLDDVCDVCECNVLIRLDGRTTGYIHAFTTAYA